MAHKRHGDGDLIHGVRALGAAIGRSHQAASDWINHETWPYGRGPWQRSLVPRMLEWSKVLNRPTTPKTQGQLISNALKGLDLEERKKNLHRVDECTQRKLRQIQVIKTRLFGEIDGLAIDPADREVVRAWLTNIVQEFHAGNG